MGAQRVEAEHWLGVSCVLGEMGSVGDAPKATGQAKGAGVTRWISTTALIVWDGPDLAPLALPAARRALRRVRRKQLARGGDRD